MGRLSPKLDCSQVNPFLSKQSLMADHLIFVSHEQFEVLKTEIICLFSSFDDLKGIISNESSAEQLFLTFEIT